MTNTDLNLAQRARKAAGLSQPQLARLLAVDQGTVAKWESGRTPTAATRALLTVMEAHPDVVVETLKKQRVKD